MCVHAELVSHRKFRNDGYGDPSAFFNDMQTCLRLPSCDQLIILDCCFSARAFGPNHIGKRKFELMTSAAHNQESPAPKWPNSFTRALHVTLKRLLKDNPKGFCTSHLYREVYHNMPKTDSPRPHLFDQARHSFGKIWLRPQVQSPLPPKAVGDGRYLKLKFRLNEKPDLAVMNELALHLQYLPYVDQIKFEDLCAPKEQIQDFMKMVVQAQKLKPLIRKIHARRQLRKVAALTVHTNQETPSSLIKLHLEQTHHPAYDWSNTERDHDYRPSHSQQTEAQMKKHGTWPADPRKSFPNRSLINDQRLAENQSNSLKARPLPIGSVSQFGGTGGKSFDEHVIGMPCLAPPILLYDFH